MAEKTKYQCHTANDSAALDAIVAHMSGVEWSPDTLDAIAGIVRSTGREIVDL